MAARRKLIVVSNRGPVSYALDEGGSRVARRGGGGLVTALRGLLSRHDVTWIASAVSPEDRAVAAAAGGAAFDETARDGSPYRLRLVCHDPVAYDRYYNVVANPLLWFVQHYLWGLGDAPELGPEFEAAWSAGYATVNATFADAVVGELARDPEAAVFFHDYHLYLAPRLVRERCPDALLAHFVHIPWPQADVWSVLPERRRRELHEGLLANDVVGFHTARWARNFAQTCAAVLGAAGGDTTVRHAGRETRVTNHPISIDPAEFDELAAAAPVLEAERELRRRHPGRILLRVDRTDPSKNIVRGFRAFGLLLDQHPELRGEVTFVARLDPSRQDVTEYANYLATIERTVREVNERFGTADWTPIALQVADDFTASVAAYKSYDVLLVNAVFDGMNLVAKEGPVVNDRDGVLVLSENAGAHEELGEWALTVNPFDVRGQADAIHRALTMDADERRGRSVALKAHVRLHDVAGWTSAQLGDVERVASAP